MAGFLLLALLGLAPAPDDGAAGEFAPPVRVEAAGKPIDTEVGHAAPFVGDFDGDGVDDLLVGQFGERHPLDLPQRGHRTGGRSWRPG